MLQPILVQIEFMYRDVAGNDGEVLVEQLLALESLDN
ncbi:hypothetical protein PMIT1323_00001 [Prochlorococcus marinus str. MIT 1323]|nr:hypothetical protein PMIT1323_00001 [Prochlorococcus marinus str. MIT 1323]